MRVLVTGVTGFLGRLVAERLLLDGHHVIGMARPGRGVDIEGVERREGDLRDAASLDALIAGAEAVVHCGARVATTGPWDEFAAVNIAATAAIIASVRRHNLRRLVHVSSLSVYDIERDGVTVTEDTAYEESAMERGFYARSKLAADQLAVDAARHGAPVTIVRPGLLYGPGRRPPVGRKSRVVGRLRLILGSANYLLPLTFGEHVADAISLILRHPGPPSPAYTIVDPQVPMREYLQVLRRVTGRREMAVFVPGSALVPLAFVLAGAVRILGRSSPVSPHQIRRSTWSARYDCSRARRDLGWAPRLGIEASLVSCFFSAAPRRAASTSAACGISS